MASKWIRYPLGALLAMAAVFALLVAWPQQSAPVPDSPAAFVMRNVRVVDVASGTAGAPSSVAIAQGKIVAVGDLPDAMAGAPVIDARGGYLVPGFWDMHVHSFQSSPRGEYPLFVANGVTSVRDMMDCPGETDTLIACLDDKRRWTRAVERGDMAAPRIARVASYYFNDPQMEPAEARRRVDQIAERGYDAVKVYDRLGRPAYLSAAQQARRRGLDLVGHLPDAVSLQTAIGAGQRSFEHAHMLPGHCATDREPGRGGADATRQLRRTIASLDADRCAKGFAALSQAGAWLVPTHVTREEDVRAHRPTDADRAERRYLDPLSRWALNDDRAATRNRYPGAVGRDALNAYLEHGRRLTGAAHAAGVGVLVGTDTVLGGPRYHDELAHLQAGGMSPADVLRAATLEAARYAGLAARRGTIAAGMDADLVLLRDNPLEDIAASRSIEAVVLAGRVFDREALDDLENFAAEQAHSPHNWAKLLWGFARSSVGSEL